VTELAIKEASVYKSPHDYITPLRSECGVLFAALIHGVDQELKLSVSFDYFEVRYVHGYPVL
jgi:hypothetical protein